MELPSAVEEGSGGGAPACRQSTPLQTSESLSSLQNNGRHFLRPWTGQPT
jgi:hypothetical protein